MGSVNATSRRLDCAVSLALCTALIFAFHPSKSRSQSAESVADSSTLTVGGPFTLIDQHGNEVTEAVLRGHYSLVYFGFTHCPEVCPLSLSVIDRALKLAGPVAETVVPVFITLDAQRDTPQALARYLASFNPRILGLTGTPKQVAAAAGAYRAYYAKMAAKDGGPDYGIEHSGYIFLMDNEGRYVAHFSRDATAKEIAARLRRELAPP